MYRLDPQIKRDPRRRWSLPDRIFFGHGACHILAGVYLSAPPHEGFYAERIVPAEGFAGNHIYVTDGTVAFDFHGYAGRLALLRHHTNGCARAYGEGWHGRLERVGFDLLCTAELNVRKMLGPDQYWGDPVARAMTFLSRLDHGASYAKALRRASGHLLEETRAAGGP